MDLSLNFFSFHVSQLDVIKLLYVDMISVRFDKTDLGLNVVHRHLWLAYDSILRSSFVSWDLQWIDCHRGLAKVKKSSSSWRKGKPSFGEDTYPFSRRECFSLSSSQISSLRIAVYLVHGLLAIVLCQTSLYSFCLAANYRTLPSVVS